MSPESDNITIQSLPKAAIADSLSPPVNCENTDVKQNRQSLFRVMQLTYYDCIAFLFIRQFTVIINK